MALGERPLRTKELTEQVRGYTPRTIYRYASKLGEAGILERHEEPGVPSKVTHSLTEPKGRELYELVVAYANASFIRLPDGRIDAHAWGSLSMLADLWESGLIEELNLGPKSPTELAQLEHGLSYHQINRRVSLFAIGGFLREEVTPGYRRTYVLTEQARRGMALIAGLGRWRQQHVGGQAEGGLTVGEVATVLRASLPLLQLPEHQERSIKLGIVGATGQNGQRGSAALTAHVSAGGAVRCVKEKASEDAWGIGTVDTWFSALLDGERDGMRTGGDVDLLDDCLTSLHETLWAAPAKVGAR